MTNKNCQITIKTQNGITYISDENRQKEQNYQPKKVKIAIHYPQKARNLQDLKDRADRADANVNASANPIYHIAGAGISNDPILSAARKRDCVEKVKSKTCVRGPDGLRFKTEYCGPLPPIAIPPPVALPALPAALPAFSAFPPAYPAATFGAGFAVNPYQFSGFGFGC